MKKKSEQINLEYTVESEDGLRPRVKIYDNQSRNRGLIERLKEDYLSKKLQSSERNILDLFIEFGIFLGPERIGVVPQELLQYIYQKENEIFGLEIRNTHILGMYCSDIDMILIDDSRLRESTKYELDSLLAHENGHKLFSMVLKNARLREKTNFDRSKNQATTHLRLLSGEQEQQEQDQTRDDNPILTKIKSLDSRKEINLTQNERRIIELDNYLSEMFAKSTELYLTNNLNYDTNWHMHSNRHRGRILGKDRLFFKALEERTYKAFSEGMFNHGLRQISIVLPLVYAAAMRATESNYRERLNGSIHL